MVLMFEKYSNGFNVSKDAARGIIRYDSKLGAYFQDSSTSIYTPRFQLTSLDLEQIASKVRELNHERNECDVCNDNHKHKTSIQ